MTHAVFWRFPVKRDAGETTDFFKETDHLCDFIYFACLLESEGDGRGKDYASGAGRRGSRTQREGEGAGGG